MRALWPIDCGWVVSAQRVALELARLQDELEANQTLHDFLRNETGDFDNIDASQYPIIAKLKLAVDNKVNLAELTGKTASIQVKALATSRTGAKTLGEDCIRILGTTYLG